MAREIWNYFLGPQRKEKETENVSPNSVFEEQGRVRNDSAFFVLANLYQPSVTFRLL